MDAPHTTSGIIVEQIYVLLQASKNTSIHMQILFNVLLGLRIQEINGPKYSDVLHQPNNIC